MAADTVPTIPTLEQLSNEIKARSWNDCITPNLESIRTWFNMDPWTQGVGAYLRDVKERLLDNLMKRGHSERDQEFIMGQIAMLREILQFPETVRKQLDNKAKANQQPRPQGEAGY